MADEKATAQLRKLEEEADQLGKSGNILGALEAIERAMEIEKRWYHLYAKAYWSYELSEGNIEAAWQAIQEGISRFPDQRFWFLYIRADLRCRIVHIYLPKEGYSLPSIRDGASEGQTDIANAYLAATTNKDKIMLVLVNPPLLLHERWHGITFNELLQKVESAQIEANSIYRTVNLLFELRETEKDMESIIEKQKKEMHADKMRTIEILGFFTAIMAFIILVGNIAFKTTYNEAMPILGGLSLVLILFVTVASLVTSEFCRYRDICKDVRTWLVFLIIIVLGFLILDSQKEEVKPAALSTNKSQLQSTEKTPTKGKKEVVVIKKQKE